MNNLILLEAVPRNVSGYTAVVFAVQNVRESV